MSHKLNLVRVLTTATGTGTSITLGAAYSQLFMTPAEAGAIDGRTYTALLSDGNNWELVRGAYGAAGTTFSRTTVLASRSGGTLGTSRISLSGSAQVRFIESAEDLDGLRGTRAVTGTSDVIANTDMGSAITYSNASAIAATIAQAGASSQFLDGWTVFVKNTGAGALTITPATSTINGGSSLALAQNLGAMIWSDGTNYHAFVMPITKPLLAANNLSDLPNAATARSNLGLTESIVTAAVGQLPGTTGTTQPAAGKIGERISATGSPSLTSSTPANVASITPTAGVWDLEMDNAFNGPGATTSNDWTTVIGTVNASVVSGVLGGYHTRLPSGADMSIVHSSRRIRVTTTGSTTYYLNAQATYSGASYSCSGTIQATRVS